MAVPAVLATLALIVITGLLFAVFLAFGGIIIAVFAFPLVSLTYYNSIAMPSVVLIIIIKHRDFQV